jgi:nitrogen fixation-related uncharacterized protein
MKKLYFMLYWHSWAMISIALGLVAVATTVHGELLWSVAPSQAEDKLCPGQ